MSLQLHDMHFPKGSRPRKKRVGFGRGSGHGKTAGRGTKGQKARSHVGLGIGFEGGQMPLTRRVPKRGFTNIFRKEVASVNLGRISQFFGEGAEVTIESLKDRGLVRRAASCVKILGEGDVVSNLRLQAHRISAGAREKLEAAGGSIELLGASCGGGES